MGKALFPQECMVCQLSAEAAGGIKAMWCAV